MKSYRLQRELWLPRSRAELFAFFSDPQNLQRITPPWLDFKILTPRGIEMKEGTLLDYRLKLRGIPLRWQSRIAVWEPPERFVDAQLRGPYKRWIHEHRFEEKAGGTLVKDNVEYAALGGPLIQRLLIARDLDRIFKYRHDILQEQIGRASCRERV